MRKIFALALSVVGTVVLSSFGGVSANQSSGLFLQDNTDPFFKAFIEYLAKHGKSYETKEEFEIRYQNFVKSMERIQSSNSQNGKSYRLGPNQFSDWSDEEFQSILGQQSVENEDITYTWLDASDLPKEVDWKAMMNPVQDQKKCGSCWSFASTAVVEGHHHIQTGELLKLSEQQQVDCGLPYGNNGCNGGYHRYAFRYIKDMGLEQLKDYPYEAKDGICRYDQTKVKTYVKNQYEVPTMNVEQLKAALTHGPVSVSVDAGGVFREYAGGILENDCGTNLNHAVVAVGYGEENGKEYFVIRNSWSPTWGEKGHIRLAAVGNGTVGTCGVLTRPTWVEVRPVQ